MVTVSEGPALDPLVPVHVLLLWQQLHESRDVLSQHVVDSVDQVDVESRKLLEIILGEFLSHVSDAGEISNWNLPTLVKVVEDLIEILNEIFLFRLFPENGRHLASQVVEDKGLDFGETRSLDEFV